MEVEKDKIKDLFSSKLGNFEPEVPASLWGGLDQLLSSQPAPAADPASSSSSSSSSSSTSTSGTSSTAGSATVVKTIAVIVGLAAAITTGVFIFSGDKDVLPEETETVIIEDETPLIEEVPDTTTVFELPPLTSPVSRATRRTSEPVKENDTDIIFSDWDDDIVGIAKPQEEEEPQPEDNIFSPVEKPETIVVRESIPKSFYIGVNASANLLSKDLTQQGGNLLFSRDLRTADFYEYLARENSNFTLKHKQPLSFGLTVGKYLTPRLSIETGLVYTHLSSEITSTSKLNISEAQKFDYLGIPLSLNYTFTELGKARLYLTVGGMVQKDIHGKYTSHMNFSIADIGEEELGNYLFYKEPYLIEKGIDQSNPQFSAHTYLGINYPLYKKLYLYGAVGGIYYFKAGNKYRTIYSDKKTQMNLNLGVKIEF